ncbi:MAG TPA: M15 family metallopeptidase [Acidimicrobiales bacterium]|nr:M15 family metallopeptidase [Acidimicrobiales bacterium]
MTAPDTERRDGRPRSRPRATVAVAVLAVVALGSGGIAAAQEPDPEQTKEERDAVRSQRGEVELQVDTLEGKAADVRAALAEIEANVDAQAAELAEAAEAAVVAQQALDKATAAVKDARKRYEALDRAADRLVVGAYVNPPLDNSLQELSGESRSDAAIMQAIIELQADSGAQTLELVAAARVELAAEETKKEEAAAAAAAAREAEAEELADLEAARAQQQKVVAQAEERLDAKLAEAAHLQTLDRELSQRLEREEAELAAQLAAQQQAAAEAAAQAAAQEEAQAEEPTTDTAASSIEPAPGGLATVTCPAGGSITVAGSIAGDVQALLDAAAADGLLLCGGGYRDPDDQIQLRMEHCGTSTYAIYEMPSSQCDPPTAPPGTSMHEQGLAIDFTCNGGGTVSYGDACYVWLSANAASYGLYNLPSEPWHWSTDGT